MRISLLLEYDKAALATAAMAIEAEACGVDQVWIAEAYGYDSVSVLGYLAAKTSRIGLASGIFPLGTRTPALLAQTAAGLDAISDGRFTLGLGTSGPQVIEGWHGFSFDRPLARTRDNVEIIRMALRRDALEYKGATITLPSTGGRPLKMINTPLRPVIPITIAALGPQNVELTAELAEGWLPMFGFFHPDRWRDVWGEPIAKGMAKRDPSLGPLDVIAGGEVCIGPGGVAERDKARALIALYAGGMGSRESNFYNNLLRRYGYEDEAKRIQDLFLDRKRDEAQAAVPTDFIEAVSLCGDEDFVRAQVARYRDAGVTNLVIRPVGDDHPGTLRALRRIVDEVAPA